MSSIQQFSSRIFSILWRVAVLSLPWQTRWIFEEGIISGFKWESATVSLYVSWIVIAALAICSALAFRDRWREKLSACASCETDRSRGLFHWIAFLKDSFKAPSFFEKVRRCFKNTVTQTVAASLIAVGLFLPTVFSAWPKASLLWWLNILILVVFFYSMWIAQVKKSTLLFWFVLSLIPHALIGLYQYANQDAIGSAILGMATHHPWLAGTSVVEHGLYRVLRAYGGLPHPNIFGGWLAVGLVASIFLVPTRKHALERIGLSLVGALFSIVLVFTYSRNAWIAAGVGLSFAVVWLWRSLDGLARLRVISFFIVIVASVGVAVGINWDHVSARFHPEENRLEAWSIASRSRSLQESRDAFAMRQVTGWGQGTSLLASVVVRSKNLTQYPILVLIDPEPAHLVPQLILVEMGLFGFLAVLALFVVAYRASSQVWGFAWREHSLRLRIPHPAFVVLMLLAVFDHFLWSVWAGQSLIAMGMLMAVQSQKEETVLSKLR